MQQLVDRQHPQPNRGQLQRERDALQPRTDLPHHHHFVWRERQVRRRRGGPLDEERHRIGLTHPPD
jgi:hypothetical protein